MRSGKWMLVLFGLVLSVVVAACGGGGTETATVAPTASATRAPQGTSAAPTARPTAASTLAPTSSATPVPVPTGQFRFAVSTIAGYSLLPGLAVNKAHLDPMYDGIVGLDSKGVLDGKSGFASAWQSNADGKVWTLKVRDGVLFHNGATATAKDVKYSLDFYASPDAQATASGSASRVRQVERVEAPDNSTAIVTFKALNIFAVLDNFTLASFGTSGGYLLPQAYIESKGGPKEATKSPVGSGPYKYKSDISNQELIMEAWDRPHWYYGTPKYRTGQVLIIPEDNTRLSLLKSGQAELADIPRYSIADLKKAGLDTPTLKDSRVNWVSLHDQFKPVLSNGTPNPFADIRVRQALNLAIDRASLNDHFLAGLGTPSIDYPVTSVDPAYKASPVLKQDVAKAKSLLAEAGYPNGFSLDLYSWQIRGIPEGQEITEAIAVYWEQIGLKVDRKPTDVNAFLAAIAKHDFPKPTALGVWAGLQTTHITGGSIKATVNRETEDEELEQASVAVANAQNLTEYISRAQRFHALYLQKWVRVTLSYSDEHYAVRKGFGGETWDLGKNAYNVNLAGMLTKPNLVR